MRQTKTIEINGTKLSPFFSSILRNSGIACILILDRNGVILEMSKGVKETFGYTEDDLIGTNFERLFIEEDKERDLPQNELKIAFKEGSAVDNNYLVHKSGQKIWCQGESIVIKDIDGDHFFVKFVYDINQQKLLEKSLQASKEFSEGILETINEALLVLDENLKVVSTNAAFRESFKIDHDLSGKSFFEISNESWDVPKLKHLLEKILPESSSVKDFKVEFDCPETKRIFCLNARQLLIEGEKQGKIVIAFQDVTNQEHAKNKLNVKNEQLNEVNKDLDVFVYTASHDLKGPINNIEALITMIAEDEECGNKLNGVVNMLQESVAKFKTTLFDLSIIAKAKNQGQEEEEIGFKTVLEEVKFDLLNKIRESDALVTDDFSDAPVVQFSKKNLRSILYNFLSNSIKYRHPERKPEIRFTTEKNNGNILLKVSDNGLGFHPENIEKIGDRYQRFHKDIEGTGIGLSIIKKIIDNTDGKLEIETENGKGTTFYVYIKQQE